MRDSLNIPGYKIKKRIGQGGMATVYLATQQSLDRQVVLKILNKVQHSADQEPIKRFIDEGRVIASLNHPNIVTIYDIGLAEDDIYISMEYVPGGDLKHFFRLPIQPKQALDITLKISQALAISHQYGVIHRDVKPGNILFRNKHTPLLTDFGIAKQIGNNMELTSSGAFLGSPHYVSPEQALGKNIDGRADIYSLGCNFYEMLTTKKPYHANTMIDIVIQHRSAPIPKLPERLGHYQALLNKMMAKKKEERYQSAQALIVDIKKIIEQHFPDSGQSSTVSTTQILSLWSNRYRAALTILLAIALLLHIGLQYIDIKTQQLDDPLKDAQVSEVLLDDTGLEQQGIVLDARLSTEEQRYLPEITKALRWLGKYSLDKSKLTHPPEDNAFYYYSRLLAINPNDPVAIQGIQTITKRYALLAERALADNKLEKAKAYVRAGLYLEPDNNTLIEIKQLIEAHQPGFMQGVLSIFK